MKLQAPPFQGKGVLSEIIRLDSLLEYSSAEPCWAMLVYVIASQIRSASSLVRASCTPEFNSH